MNLAGRFASALARVVCLWAWLAVGWPVQSVALVVPASKPWPQLADRTLTTRSDNLVQTNGSVGLVVIVHGWQDSILPTTRNPPTDPTRAYNLTADGWVPRMVSALRPAG